MAIKVVRYDFSDMHDILGQISNGNHSQAKLNDLKDELNRFFKDSKCMEVLYTENNDKLFFGMSVIPVIKGSDVDVLLNGDEVLRVSQYYIELDSKLFDPLLGMTPEELTAILLHEIGHIVNTREPVEDIRKAIAVYLMDNKEVLQLSDSVHYREILAYGIKNSFRKFASIFEKKDDEILADEFCIAYGYGPALESAFDKLVKNSRLINRDVDDKLVVLTWTLRLYKDVKHRRIAARRQMKRSMSLTPSRLEKKEMQNVINRLDRIDDDALLEAAGISGIRQYLSDQSKKQTYKSVRDFENELFEFQLRVKQVNDEDEAYSIMRQINLRMAVIDDYTHSDKDMDTSTRDRYFAVYDRYARLREELAKKEIYNNYSSLYVKYPDIKQGRY